MINYSAAARKAADLIEANGLHKGDYYPYGRRHDVAADPHVAASLPLCAAGALRVAVDPDSGCDLAAGVASLEDSFADYLCLRDQALEQLDADDERNPGAVIATWNDDADRTRAQVVEVLCAFADECEGSVAA